MRASRNRLGLLGLAAVVLGTSLAVVVDRAGDRPGDRDLIAAAAHPSTTATTRPTSTTSTTSIAVATSSTVAVTAPPAAAPPTTRPPAPPGTAAPVTTAARATTRTGAWTLGPLRGLGAWVDVYDWTDEFTGGRPKVTLPDIDGMAEAGVQTVFIQSTHRNSAADVIEPDRLRALIDRAHARGMAVVAWHLPTLEDVPDDLRRLVAASQLPVDGLGVDIEWRSVTDVAERNRRLLELSTSLRRALGSRALTAITPSAVQIQVINPNFWPGFPWAELARTYDAIVPMSYWSFRTGEWKSGERYAGEDIDRIRASTGRPDMPIHVVGGIADGVTVDELQGMARAITNRGALGGSLYDWSTSQPAQWNALRPLRVG